MHLTRKGHFWAFVLAALAVGLLYGTHFLFCQRSTLQLLDVFFADSDMHANLMWAKGIREQGWLNPAPYHPWNNWMQTSAPYSQWVEWWGGPQIFQQPPLYAYLLSLFVQRLVLMRIFQALLSIGTCIFIGLFTARLSGSIAGWLAFWLAVLYAPFYAYSWPFLHDGLAWFVTAALLWALSELTHAAWPSDRARRFAWVAGVLLGLGFLTRESYVLLIPVVLAALASLGWRRDWSMVARVGMVIFLTVSPLLIRNWVVQAPLLSTSNRFAETFIHGNAGSTNPYVLSSPPETARILYRSRGRPLPVIWETIASHPRGVRGWMRLQLRKLLSLLDPYELPDNLSFYFVARISPMVRLGLRYWMILPPALAGLFLSVQRRERAYFWLWLLLPIFLLSFLVGFPISRYRQSLTIFLIPWAAYFAVSFGVWIRRREFHKAAYYGAALLVAWALILGPLSRQPSERYERPAEYLVSAEIFHRLGEEQKAQEMLGLVRQRFPGALPTR